MTPRVKAATSTSLAIFASVDSSASLHDSPCPDIQRRPEKLSPLGLAGAIDSHQWHKKPDLCNSLQR